MSLLKNKSPTLIKSWRENALKYCDEFLHLTLEKWQEEMIEPLGGEPNPRRRVAAKACTGPGKTFALAVGGWHRLTCFGRKGEHPKGAALSGEGRDNLRDNLWAELAKLQQRNEFLKSGFTWTGERIYANDHSEDWFLSARSYAKDATPEAIGTSLSGLHSNYPFLLLDEIGRMPVTVGQKASQIFTGGVVDGLIMAAGNPVSQDGLLYHISSIERALWKMITITADPDDPRRTKRVDLAHAKEQIELYGRDNPWVMATILGMFPPGGINTLLSVEDVEKAMARHYADHEYNTAQYRMGVDCARFGDDRTVIFPRQGIASFKPVIMRGERSHVIAARVMVEKDNRGSDLEFVDDTGGYGSGVIDSLIQAQLNPRAINFSSEALDKKRFYNIRAEMWWKMAEWIKERGHLPKIMEMVKELTTPTYSFKDGRILLESKDQIKKRLGSSPDLADGLALTFAIPEQPKNVTPRRAIKTKLQYDSDPYANS